MANAKDITAANSNILLVGDSGSHKTYLLGQVPGIYVFDFDRGMATNRGLDIEYDTFKDLARSTAGVDIKGGPAMEKQGLYTFGTGWDAFWKRVVELNELFMRNRGPKAIGLDSLTFMSMLAVNKILKDTAQPLPHQGTWNAHHQYFKEVFSMMTAWPTRLIATAHIERTTNDLTGVSEKLPNLVGKLAAITGAFFDDVLIFDVNPKAGRPGELEFTIATAMTPVMRQAKSRWGVPDGTPTDWAQISKHLPELPGTVVETPKMAVPKPAGAK